MAGREALSLYKTLHRTVQKVFRGDLQAMFAARDKVCDEFEKNRGVTSEVSIRELLKQGQDVNTILNESVVQIQKKEDEKFELNIRPETHMFENNPFRDDVTAAQYRAENRKAKMKGRCDDEPKKPREPRKKAPSS